MISWRNPGLEGEVHILQANVSKQALKRCLSAVVSFDYKASKG